MKAPFILTACLAGLLVTPAFAHTPVHGQHSGGPEHNVCLQIGRIWNWHVRGSRTLVVENDINQKFRVHLMAPCPGLRFSNRIGFDADGSTNLSCLGSGDSVVFRNTGIRTSCPISAVTAHIPRTERAKSASDQRAG